MVFGEREEKEEYENFSRRLLLRLGGVARHGELAGLGDENLLGRGGAVEVLDLAHNLHALGNLAEHDVAAVQPGGFDGADEELGAVGVGAGAVYCCLSVKTREKKKGGGRKG